MTRHLRRSALAAGAAVASLAVAAAAAAPASAEEHGDDPVVLTTGHVDALDVHFDDGALQLMIKDDTSPPPVVRDPADVILHAAPGAATTVPDDPRYAFLGEPHDDIWVLPQSQDPDLLWPGWNTERLSPGTFDADEVTVTLLNVDGPAFVSIFHVNAFGDPAVRWHADADGAVDPAALSVPVNTHAHANFAFGAEGEYTLTYQVDATLADGGDQVSSGPVDYAFRVGDGSGQDEVTLTIEGMRDGYAEGEAVTLTAVPEPDTGQDHYHWYRQCPDEGTNGRD